jgi:CBS domain
MAGVRASAALDRACLSQMCLSILHLHLSRSNYAARVAVLMCTLHCAALELLVSNSVTGMPVLDDDGRVVGVVSDYDLLSLEGIAEQVNIRTTSYNFQILLRWSLHTLHGFPPLNLEEFRLCCRPTHSSSSVSRAVAKWYRRLDPS